MRLLNVLLPKFPFLSVCVVLYLSKIEDRRYEECDALGI